VKKVEIKGGARFHCTQKREYRYKTLGGGGSKNEILISTWGKLLSGVIFTLILERLRERHAMQRGV
jgi:hypothetical protein